jgi:hypothetical protein
MATANKPLEPTGVNTLALPKRLAAGGSAPIRWADL